MKIGDLVHTFTNEPVRDRVFIIVGFSQVGADYIVKLFRDKNQQQIMKKIHIDYVSLYKFNGLKRKVLMDNKENIKNILDGLWIGSKMQECACAFLQDLKFLQEMEEYFMKYQKVMAYNEFIHQKYLD